MLMSSHVSSWVLMSAYEGTLEFIGADVFDENIKQKMLTFKITSL